MKKEKYGFLLGIIYSFSYLSGIFTRIKWKFPYLFLIVLLNRISALYFSTYLEQQKNFRRSSLFAWELELPA